MFVLSYNNITKSEEKFLKKNVAVLAGWVQTEVQKGHLSHSDTNV
jgi:hypothetical protein